MLSIMCLIPKCISSLQGAIMSFFNEEGGSLSICWVPKRMSTPNPGKEAAVCVALDMRLNFYKDPEMILSTWVALSAFSNLEVQTSGLLFCRLQVQCWLVHRPTERF